MGQFAENPSHVIENLSEQVQILKSKVEHLSSRLTAIENDRLLPTQQSRVTSGQDQRADSQEHDTSPSLIDTKALLPRIATICFLLVVALILRTITDNQIINTQAGSTLGMAYAAILILLGWRLYEKKSRLAPVFPGCGILLLFSIVLETHGRFESLSTIGAYSILFIAGVSIFAMSVRYRASALICLGVPGTAGVALAIDFPYPIYPIMGLLLLSAILAASYAFKQQMCRYLRWITLGISVIFWLLWTSKIETIPACAEPIAEAMYPSWFFPMLFIFWGVYLTTVVLNVLKKDLQLGFFESLLPTVTAIGAFWAGHTAVYNWFENENLFYSTIIVIAMLHLALAWWLARHDREKASGSNVFTLAGTCLIVLTSATVVKNIGYILPVWSASALALLLLSASWKNEGIRVTSYLLQATTCIVAVFSTAVMVPTALPVATGLSALSLCVFSLIQYNWSRSNHPDPTHSFYFSKLDTKDYSAVILLLAGLLGGYYFSQFVLHEMLSNMFADFDQQFKSGQSIIINISAMILMFIALRGKNREIIIIATIIAILGGIKVFIFDLFGIKGVPLVLSVFSYGVVAAFASVVMGKWQKKEAETA